MTIKITKKIIDQVRIDDKMIGRFLWDNELKGYGIRVGKQGNITYVVQYRNQYSQTKRLKLGAHPALNAEQARALAIKTLSSVLAGEDPASDKKTKYKSAAKIKYLCDMYATAMKEGKIFYRGKAKTQLSILSDLGRIERHIKPLLGNMPIEAVTRSIAEQAMHDIIAGKTACNIKTEGRGRIIVTGGPGAAKKTINLLGAMWDWGVKQAFVRQANPVRDIEKPADGIRTRILSNKELAIFGEIWNQHKQNSLNFLPLQAVLFLFLTGWRKGEVLSLKSDYIDYDNQVVNLPSTKTGKQSRPIGRPAIKLLEKLTPNDQRYLFPSNTTDSHIVNLKVFRQIREQAEITDFRLHDIRHCFASLAAELGYSDSTIGALIGHKGSTITSRYIQRYDRALVNAADEIAEVILEKLMIRSIQPNRQERFDHRQQHINTGSENHLSQYG